MRTIYKYPIEIRDQQTIQVPVTGHGGGPDFLHVGLDALGKPSIWLEVDPEGSPRDCNVYVVGTGMPLPSSAAQHLGTFVQGPYVWHLYV